MLGIEKNPWCELSIPPPNNAPTPIEKETFCLRKSWLIFWCSLGRLTLSTVPAPPCPGCSRRWACPLSSALYIDENLKTIKEFALIWAKKHCSDQGKFLNEFALIFGRFQNEFLLQTVYIYFTFSRKVVIFRWKWFFIDANLKTIKEFALIWAKNIAQIKANSLMNLYWFSAVLKMIFAPNRIYLLHFFAKSHHFFIQIKSSYRRKSGNH